MHVMPNHPYAREHTMTQRKSTPAGADPKALVARDQEFRGPRRAGFPLLSHQRACWISNVRSRTSLKQAQVKVKTARTLASPRCRSFLRPPAVFIQPKASSTILRRLRLTA